MRPQSSCTFCRLQKKKCTVRHPGGPCTLCTAKQQECNLAGGSISPGQRILPSLLSHTQKPALPTAVHEGSPAPAPRSGSVSSTLPPASVCNELLDLYFDLVEGKQLFLFHPQTFLDAQYEGRASEFLVLGMVALTARFSTNPYFESIHPWDRGKPWHKKAMQSFNNRQCLIDIPSLQGSMLLAFVAFVEGDSDLEALLASQALCIVRMMGLPAISSPDPIEQELGLRLYWACWTLDTWHSARTLKDRQLVANATLKRPLDEEVFKAMRTDDPPDPYFETRIESLGLRLCGFWSSMLSLTGIHGQVMELNDEIAQGKIREADIQSRVNAISDQLDAWLQKLPPSLQHTPENWKHYTDRRLGREFAAHQMVYHHQCQLLYYQFLNKDKTSVQDASQDEVIMVYAAKCKAHAIALSQAMWDTNSLPGMECLWSPINGHLLVVASSVLLHILLFDTNEESITRAKQLLERNFLMLLQLRKYWSLVEVSMTRFHAFHRACQMNGSPEKNFKIDSWLVHFLNRYDSEISDRYEYAGPTVESRLVHHALQNPRELWREMPLG